MKVRPDVNEKNLKIPAKLKMKIKIQNRKEVLKMITREENLEKINAELEQLSNEQLDEVVVGFFIGSLPGSIYHRPKNPIHP